MTVKYLPNIFTSDYIHHIIPMPKLTIKENEMNIYEFFCVNILYCNNINRMR